MIDEGNVVEKGGQHQSSTEEKEGMLACRPQGDPKQNVSANTHPARNIKIRMEKTKQGTVLSCFHNKDRNEESKHPWGVGGRGKGGCLKLEGRN